MKKFVLGFIVGVIALLAVRSFAWYGIFIPTINSCDKQFPMSDPEGYDACMNKHEFLFNFVYYVRANPFDLLAGEEYYLD